MTVKAIASAEDSAKPKVSGIKVVLFYDNTFLTYADSAEVNGFGNMAVSANPNQLTIVDFSMQAGGGKEEVSYSISFKAANSLSASSIQTKIGVAEAQISDPENNLYSKGNSSTHEGSSTVKISEYAPSNEARLGSLTIVPGKWNRSFDPDVTDYSIEVDAGTSALALQYSPKESHGKVIYWPYTRPGFIDVAPGTMNFTLQVTAQDGTTTKEYHISIHRPEPAPTQPPTTPAQTTPAETTAEPVPDETTAEETTTPEETTAVPAVIRIPAQELEVMDYPQDFEIPAGYKTMLMTDEDGTEYHALIPEDQDGTDICLVYGAKDGGAPGLYIYDSADGTLQRFDLMLPLQSSSEEETTEEVTEEETTEEETTEAVTPEETQEPTTEPYRLNFLNGDTKVPGWVTTAAAALLFICLLTVLLLLLARSREKKAIRTEKEQLSPEEEEEFLRVSRSTFYPEKTEGASSSGQEAPEPSAAKAPGEAKETPESPAGEEAPEPSPEEASREDDDILR